MPDIKIRNVDPVIIKSLDDIVVQKKYSSRNELINEILTLYVTSSSVFFNKTLLPTVTFLAKEAISEHQDIIEKSLALAQEINLKVLEELRKLTELSDE